MDGLLAVLSVEMPKPSKVPGLVASDMVLIIGLGALLFGGLISWIVFVRGPRKHPSENRTYPKPSTPPVTVTEDGRERHRKKRRSRRAAIQKQGS